MINEFTTVYASTEILSKELKIHIPFWCPNLASKMQYVDTLLNHNQKISNSFCPTEA